MVDEADRLPDEAEAFVVGILGCIEAGTAHLNEDERKKWREVAEPNLLLVEDEDG